MVGRTKHYVAEEHALSPETARSGYSPTAAGMKHHSSLPLPQPQVPDVSSQQSPEPIMCYTALKMRKKIGYGSYAANI